jgi:uncharacterized protein (TIGR03437 family)
MKLVDTRANTSLGFGRNDGRTLRRLMLVLAATGLAFGQTYTIDTIAGGGLPVSIPGTSAGIGSAFGGIAVDSAGNVFFVAQDYNIVLRLDAASGEVTLVAGNGTYGFSGDNGPAGSAQLAFPAGVAVDSAGNVYIADPGNGRIRKVSNGIITTVAGGGASLGDNGPATSALLYTPVGIALDSAGNLYIADAAGNRIRKISNGMITTVAGSGTPSFGGDNGPATSAELNQPAGVAVDSAGDIYIADTLNDRIREVSNGIIATVAGAGLCSAFMRFGQTGNGDNGPATSAQLCGPEGVATDSAGNFYIADGWNLIREVSGGIITAVAGGGASLGDYGPATSALLGSGSGIAFDSSGNLYIADGSNNRIRKVSGGIITTIAGNGTGFGGDNGPATSAQLDLPSGVAVDSTGDLYIGDARNGRVRRVSNGVITTVAGNGTPGSSGDNGPATAAQLNGTTYGLAVDSAGNLYIADAYNCRVRKVSNGVIANIAGNGFCGFSGDNGPPNAAQLNVPSGVAVDSAGNIYIADTNNHRIREVSNGVIITVAGSVTGGFAGDGGDAINAELNFPEGVAVDSAGNLYIADTNNSRVRRVSGGVITTVAGNGSGYSGDNGPAISAGLSYPSSVAVDSAGSLYIAGDPYRIRKVSGGVITTVAGAGATVADGTPPANAALNAPSSIAVDPSGNVYISDTGNDRVRVLTPSGASCAYTVSPLSFSAVGSSGGNLVATIQTASGCTWAVQSLPQWIAWSGNTVGTGAATITLAAAANSGDDRSAVISIAGVPILVTQTGTGSTVNGASYSAAVVPGSVASVFGNFPLSSPVSATEYPLPTNISGLSVQLGGSTLAPLLFTSSGQINFQVPWELAGQSQTTLAVVVNGQAGTAQALSLAPFAPAIFSVNDQGTGQGAILDLSNRLVDSTNPAAAGDWVSIYCTGLGAVGYQPATGSPAPIPTGPDFPLSWTLTEPAVTIGGVETAVIYWGLAPGYVGLYQLNANVPAVTPGNAIPVTVYIGGAVSNTVTIAVR